MHFSGPLTITFESPEQRFGSKIAKMRVRENPVYIYGYIKGSSFD